MTIETIKFSEFISGGDLNPNEVIVGLDATSTINTSFTTFPMLPPGTTADRPAAASTMYYRLRFNTTIESYEYYSPVLPGWIQLSDSEDVIGIIGTANQVLANGTSGTLETGPVTLTTPQDIGLFSAVQFNSVQFNSDTSILDHDGNVMVSFAPQAAAVNHLVFTNGPLGISPSIMVEGDDATLNLGFYTKGGSQFDFFTTATNPVVFLTGPGYQHQSVFGFPISATTHTYIFPSASGTVCMLDSGASTPSNGFVPIGNGTTFSAAALTAGTGVSITNGAASITINAVGGGTTTTSIAGTTQAAAVNTRYIVANAAQTTITLPTTFAIGDVVIIKGLGAGGWILAAGTATTIRLGSSVTSSAGSLTSANQYDTIAVSGLVANTTWSADYVFSAGLTVA